MIDRLDGATGKLIQRLTHPEGGEFGDLAIGADGRLYAVWAAAEKIIQFGLRGE